MSDCFLGPDDDCAQTKSIFVIVQRIKLTVYLSPTFSETVLAKQMDRLGELR